MFGWLFFILAFVIIVTSTIIFLASRYRRCPSDAILVIYGKVGGDSARCIHGGGTFVWPLIQESAYISLTPITINIPLQNALSLQNIRVNVPSTFTVGISIDPAVMNNAAERLLGLAPPEIEQLAREIIFGQLRLTVASLTIEQINQDRESFLASIRRNVEPELNKIGLYLINVNITDITDVSGYIDALGKKAASEAINRALVDVAEQEKSGSIGQTTAYRDRDIRVAENQAEAAKGKKRAEADQRIFVQGQEADAVGGENKAKADIAAFNAELAVRQAEALQRGEVAKRLAEVEIQKAQYKSEIERMTADDIATKEIEKRQIEISAEAEAERIRRTSAGEADRTRFLAKGEADAILVKYQAEAEGIRKLLDSKAAGYQELIKSCGGNAQAAATMLMVEKIEQLVATQVDAIKNLRIDKVVVWDGNGGGGADGKSATARLCIEPDQEHPALARHRPDGRASNCPTTWDT
jgi:flotillin